ncbi:hypothetical protein BAUCODRAFT_245995 [Baudoinia panamericana UAMH 10762]|uniref:Carboxylic ester hydrolase n=1 Tax=Baudoinia panamericana (strain UAMH 10762) TaxID=717646 RepID=M2LHE7_BAUPA|nr:uncharacterized protein BAUCODRAFT_245995 [Baudoinia panamericana UAMH 10762]EMC93577.1 hypothetical protein BAUCODRAFT_245995 [Baudoinia panamericana UAMH 10762]
MHFNNVSYLVPLVPLAAAFNCTPSAFQSILPSNASVAYAYTLAAGSTFNVGYDIAYPTSPQKLPALCAVQINVTSSPSSAFSFGLFLPVNWNNRFLAVGNGGFAGGINWLDMAAGVQYGFAVVSTDTGHNSTSGDLSWALNQPQKQIDWGYRAIHGSVVLSKQVVQAYYSATPKFNYYSGCSTGGRQGIRDIQLYPEDFDGVLAGAPAWWTSHLQTWTVKLGLYNLPTTAAHHIPTALFSAIGAEVLRQCDPQDGLVDTIISDPRRCDFYPEALLCTANVTNQTAAGCLTAAQIGTLYQIYNDYVETNQTLVFPHLELGSEAQWPVLLGGSAPSTLGYQYVQDLVLNDTNWSFYDFNYSIVQLADQIQPGNATAYDFDLTAFHTRGGKLLQYHGLADALIAPGSSVYFYKEVLKTLLPKGITLDSWYRFFLVPGMQHCSGTPANINAPWYFAGANQAGSIGTNPGSVYSVPGFTDAKHDALLALMAWVENGMAPDSIIATKWINDTITNTVLRQRPLCPYPQQAVYLGLGDPNEASNWQCGRFGM